MYSVQTDESAVIFYLSHWPFRDMSLDDNINVFIHVGTFCDVSCRLSCSHLYTHDSVF